MKPRSAGHLHVMRRYAYLARSSRKIGPMFKPPPVRFSPWVQWHERGGLKSGHPEVGVYLWAYVDPPTNRLPDPSWPDLPSELIYAGETNNLNRRPLGSGHHRLKHYRDTFPGDPEL